MEIVEKINGCFLIENNRIKDKRGWFQVAVNFDELRDMGVKFEKICQLNHTLTVTSGTIRGFNYQEEPYAQAKLVRCIKGSLYSVGLNINKSSKDYGKWCGYILDATKNQLMYIPRGYAHAFLTLENNTELEYFTDNIYSFSHSKSVSYKDKGLGINWNKFGVNIHEELLSKKNKEADKLEEIFK